MNREQATETLLLPTQLIKLPQESRMFDPLRDGDGMIPDFNQASLVVDDIAPVAGRRLMALGIAGAATVAGTIFAISGPGILFQVTSPEAAKAAQQDADTVAAEAPLLENLETPLLSPTIIAPSPTDIPSQLPNQAPLASTPPVIEVPAPTPIVAAEAASPPPAPAEASAAAVPALEIPAPVAPPPPPPPDTIVTSYNTHDEVPAAETAAEIRILLAESTIVGAQELAQSEKQEKIRAEIPLCPEPTCKYDGQVAQGAAGGTSIFWDNERYDRVEDPETGVFKLHETHRIKNGPDSAYGKTSVMKQKVLTVVRLKDMLTGEDKYVVDAHLPYGIQDGDGPDEDEKARMELLQEDMAIITHKLTKLKAAGIDIILMGDFNWREDLDHALSPENIFQAMGFKSFYDPDVQNLSPNVFGTHGKGNKPKYRRIDYIMYYSPDGETILSRTILQGFKSDHNPVRAAIQS